MSDEPLEIKQQFLKIGSITKEVDRLFEFIKMITPDNMENETGKVSNETYRKRINIMMVALVIAAKSFDQPKDFLLQNLATLYDGIETKCKHTDDSEKRRLN